MKGGQAYGKQRTEHDPGQPGNAAGRNPTGEERSQAHPAEERQSNPQMGAGVYGAAVDLHPAVDRDLADVAERILRGGERKWRRC